MTNESDLIVGFRGGVNLLVISNGGTVAVDGNNYGTVIGLSNTANNNSIVVTGTNANGNASTLTNTQDLYVGYSGSSNNLWVSGSGQAANFNGWIGYSNTAMGNSALVSDSGSLWSNAGDMIIGVDGSGNSLVVSNGGQVAVNGVNYGAVIGLNSDSSNNSVLVTGSNTSASVLTLTNADIYIGYAGSSNMLTVNGGAQVANFNGWIGYSNTAVGNAVQVSGFGSLWTNSGDLYIGADGSGNSLVIRNGGQVSVDSSSNGAVIGYGSNSSGNSVQVNDASLFAGADTNGGHANADLYVGYNGSSNSIVITNGGQVYVSGNNIGAVIGYGSNSSGNSMLVSGSDGNGNYSSLNVGADKNSVFYNVDLIVGYNGSSNSLVISNGGQAYVSGVRYGMVIGFNDGSSNNSVLVTGSSSTITNGMDLYVGYGGSGTLTVANGGTVYADNSITIASSNGAVGTLNIGSLGGNDTAGTIVTPSVAFGSGTGTINFNQTDTITLASSISGLGTVQKLGTGTAILSGSNSYTGSTLIIAGSLEVVSTNGLGSSSLTLGGSSRTATLSLATNLSDISGFNWATNGVVSLTEGLQTMSVSGVMSNVASEGGTFEFVNPVLDNTTNTLINFTSQSNFTTSSFNVEGIQGYSFALTNTNVSACIAIDANLIISTNVAVNNTLTVSSFTLASPGTLSGYGTVNGTVNNNGKVAPSYNNVPGTLNINGNYTQGSGGILQILVGNSANSMLVVNGTAILGGTLALTSTSGGLLPLGSKYTFLAASYISGAFSSTTAPDGERVRVVIEGDPTAIAIIGPESYTQMAANRNQTNVATALNSFIPYTSGDQLTVSTSLDSLTASEFNQAFNAIMPTFYQQIATIAFNEANAQNM